jgi:peptidoglycan/LPS O-acetylase OafA/YrhL
MSDSKAVASRGPASQLPTEVAANSQTSGGPPPPERFYLPELDILRFFAFFAVLVYHIPPGSLLFYLHHGALGAFGAAGCFGVDLFFTLSGYLITRLLLRERETTGHINLRAFYIRRILRIWPLYFFYLAFAFLLSRLVPPFTQAGFPADPICMLFLGCFLFNFAPCGLSLFVSHLWTISLEEQFYLVWSLTIRHIPRRRMLFAPLVMLVIATIARLPSSFLSFGVPIWNNSFARLDPIAAGILIAVLPELSPRPAVRSLLALTGIASWWVAAYWCGLPVQESGAEVLIGYPMVALGSGAFLLATVGAGRKSAGTRIRRGLIYLGKISYGLYVYCVVAILGGQSLIRLVSPWLYTHGWPLWTAWSVYLGLTFGANVMLAAASYRWLEAPFLRLKGRFAAVPSRAV